MWKIDRQTSKLSTTGSQRGVLAPLSQVEDVNMDLLAFHFNNKLDRFIDRSRDPWAFAGDTLVIQWDEFHLIYAFIPLKTAPRDQIREHFGDS